MCKERAPRASGVSCWSLFFFLRILAEMKCYQLKWDAILGTRTWLAKSLFLPVRRAWGSAISTSRYKEGVRMSLGL